MKKVLLLTWLLAFAGWTNAQVKTNFNSYESLTSGGKYIKNFRAKSPYVIPARDIKSLLEKEALENMSGEVKPFRIAEAVGVDIDVVEEAEWVEEEGFAYGKFSVVAAGAKSISANFDRFYLPQGTELYVYSENGEMITGPVTEAENNENIFWGSWVYKGGKLTVDFKTPVESKSSLKLHISSIAYGYKDLYVGNFDESSACNVNVLCPAGNGWQNERNSVSLILNGNSTAICSGALVNNTCNVNIPYLLTANHCFDGSVANWKFTFQAWSATCTPSQNANGLTFNGSTLRARNAGSDFCLLELNQLPPGNSGITFSGWSRANTASPSGVSISHPRGDVMKIATYNQTITQQIFLNSSDWRVTWASGTVEPTSSGGPLYDNNHRIIGQVHGGNPSNICTANDHAFFGRFDVSWTGGGTAQSRLSDWLDPANTGSITTNARAISFVTGPALVCTSGTFTLQNHPPGTTITWSSSNPSILALTSAQGANPAVFSHQSYNGSVVITANINGNCGSRSVTLPVWGGGPVIQYIDGPTTVQQNVYYTYYARPDPDPNVGPTTYYWYIYPSPGFYATSTTNQKDISFFNSGYNTVVVTSENACGSGFDEPNLEVYVQGSGYFAMSPNPASQNVQVKLVSHEASTSLQSTEAGTYRVQIYDMFGVSVLSEEKRTSEFSLSTANLKDGIYMVELTDGKNVYTKRLMVKH